jgi:hypothetical protein
VQPELIPEWNTWKQELIKQYFSLHPAGNVGNFEKNNCYDDPALDQQGSRKRPKLEVRRGEIQISHMGEADYRTPTEDPNQNNLPGNSVMHENVGALGSTDQNNSVTLPGSFGTNENTISSSANAALQNARLDLDSFKSSRQCSEHIEAKGRQCTDPFWILFLFLLNEKMRMSLARSKKKKKQRGGSVVGGQMMVIFTVVCIKVCIFLTILQGRTRHLPLKLRCAVV